jgi:hypothetical protein
MLLKKCAVSITEVPLECFSNCINLSDFDFSNISVIESEAFKNCYKLENLISDSVKQIKSSAFANCNGLKKVILPNCMEMENYFRSQLIETFYIPMVI